MSPSFSSLYVSSAKTMIPTDKAPIFRGSTFRIMYDVPSIVVFRSKSIECFHSTASKIFKNLLLLFRCPQLLQV
jgi:hypothetical protein